MTRIVEKYGLTNREALERLDYRRAKDLAVSSYVNLPIKVAADAAGVYQRLIEAESVLFPGHDYTQGSASVENSLIVIPGNNRVLLTAEHASDQVRKGQSKEADFGTGGLAQIVAQDTDSTAIIANGLQTSDPNYSSNHPLKGAMVGTIADTRNRAHLNLHLLDRGRASTPRERRGFSVMLGIGRKPSDATMELKDHIVEAGKDLGLRMAVNRAHIDFKNKQLRFKRNGEVKKVTFAAAGPNTTRTFSQTLAEQIGKKVFAAVQLEFNEVFLVGQEVQVRKEPMDYPTQFDRELGAFIGYHFTKLATEAAARL